MSEAALYILAGLVGLGALFMAFTPFDRRGGRKKPSGNPYEGMDAYAMLWNMVEEGRLGEARRAAGRLLKTYRRLRGPADIPGESIRALEEFSRMVGGRR